MTSEKPTTTDPKTDKTIDVSFLTDKPKKSCFTCDNEQKGRCVLIFRLYTAKGKEKPCRVEYSLMPEPCDLWKKKELKKEAKKEGAK